MISTGCSCDWSKGVLVLVVGFILTGCHFNVTRSTNSQQEDSILSRLGYERAMAGQPALDAAIRNTNLILDQWLRIRLVPGWAEETATPIPARNPIVPTHQATPDKDTNSQTVVLGGFHDLASGATIEPKSYIPVHLVYGKSLVETDVSFVPQNETCIIVHAGGLEYMRRIFSGMMKGRESFPADEEYALTLILLHEVGHIVHNDTGHFTDTHPFTLAEITGPDNAVTNTELSADLFAVAQLREASSAGFPLGRSPAALTVATAMNDGTFNFLNAGAREIIEKGPRPPLSFLDRGYSHPNIELRFLIMAYKYHQNDVLLAEIADFLKRRADAAAPTSTPR